MPTYDEMRDQFGKASAEEKLVILRHELLRAASMAIGYSDLLKLIDKNALNSIQADAYESIEGVSKAVTEIHDIIRALTD